MNAEEKQELIEYCKEVQGNNPESSDAYKVISIALAALTAQPVKLPKTYLCDRNCGSEDLMHLYDTMLVKNQVISAIRVAGYEVQE